MPLWPKAVIFDLYETLVSEFDPAWTPQPSMATRLGVEETAFNELWRQLNARRMTGGIEDFTSALRAICHRLGHTPNEPIITQLHQERQTAKARPFTHLEADVLTMVTRLHALSIKLGVLSNAACEEVSAWDTCALAPFFDTVVFSYQVGLMKPDPQVYALACDRLGVSPAHTLFVGDGGSDELVGAATAGLTAYWARWFFEQWPSEKRSLTWRERASRFPSLSRPEDLIHLVQTMRSS
jgi:HAD superfamily hydrolase (TIGR01509 family)